MTPEQAQRTTKMAESVINHMLAPHLKDAFRIPVDAHPGPSWPDVLELRVRWHLSPISDAFRDPRAFILELEDWLRPISEAITYGEVGELRKEVERLKIRAGEQANRIRELQACEDALKALRVVPR